MKLPIYGVESDVEPHQTNKYEERKGVLVSPSLTWIIEIAFSDDIDTIFFYFSATHCRERHYSFQIKRCSDPECCRPASREWEWLPDPILDHTGQHFKPLRGCFRDKHDRERQTFLQKSDCCTGTASKF